MKAKTLIFFFLIVFFTTISIIKFTKALQAQIHYNESRTENPYHYDGQWYHNRTEAESALSKKHPGATYHSFVNDTDTGVQAYVYNYTTTPRP